MSQIPETFEKVFELFAAGQLAEGKALLGQLEDKFGRTPLGLLLHGVIAFHEGDFETARNNLMETCLQSPHFEAFLFLAQAEFKLENTGAAKAALDQGLALFSLDTLNQLTIKQIGELYFQLGAYNQVIEVLKKYLETKPDDASAWQILGSSFSKSQSPEQALSAYHRAFKIDPSEPSTHLNLSVIMRQLRQLESAKKHLEMAGKLDHKLYDPSSLSMLSASLLNFEDFERYSKDAIKILTTEKRVTEPFSFFFLTDDPQLIKQANQIHSSQFESLPRPYSTKQKHSDEKIRIGYVSADFKNHATTYLINGLIRKHDRERFDVLGFDFSNKKSSEYRDEILNAFDRVIDLSDKNDEAAAELIRSHEIDILIDLKGYTENCRPNIFGRRPSRIQVNYLGYPGTMGHPSIDYIIGDRIVTPAKYEENFSESLVILPCCYQPNNPNRTIGQNQTKNEIGLPENKFIFCCFNHHWKWNETILNAWRVILNSCPNSILWLMTPLTGADLNCQLEKFSIPTNQVILTKAVKIQDHLARLQHADLFLDTFPCGAHTTASDAIFAGVPVLSILGQSFHSRVSSSLMMHAGLPEFVCESVEEYVTKAIEAYRDSAWTNAQRSILLDRGAMTHPYNLETTVQSIELAYQKMFAAETTQLLQIDPWWS